MTQMTLMTRMTRILKLHSYFKIRVRHPRLKDKFITGQEYRPKPPYSEGSSPDGFIKSAVTSALKRTPS